MKPRWHCNYCMKRNGIGRKTNNYSSCEAYHYFVRTRITISRLSDKKWSHNNRTDAEGCSDAAHTSNSRHVCGLLQRSIPNLCDECFEETCCTPYAHIHGYGYRSTRMYCGALKKWRIWNVNGGQLHTLERPMRSADAGRASCQPGKWSCRG